MDISGKMRFICRMAGSFNHRVSRQVYEIFDLYTELHGTRVSLFGPGGELLYPDEQSRPNCTYCSLLREKMGLDARCRESDRQMMEESLRKKALVIYTCHGGMREAVAPLFVDDQLAGFMMIGQFRSGAAPRVSPYAANWKKEKNKQLLELQRRLLEVNPVAEMLCISAQQGTNVDRVIRKITALVTQDEKEKPVVELSVDNDLPQAAIFARSAAVEFPNPAANQLIDQFLQQLSQQLKSIDGILIGHLKAIAKTEPTGYAVFSVTHHDQPPVQKGRMSAGPVEKLTLTVNAIVYGMNEGPFKRLCLAQFRALENKLAER